MEIQTTNYYAKNQKGDILFKIELSNIEAFPWLRFACSLEIDFNKYPKLKRSIEDLCSPNTNEEEKAMLLKKIILQIKRIEGVEAFYFKGRSTQAEPDLKNGIVRQINYIFEQDDFKPYVPFCDAHNPYFFSVLKKKLAQPNQLKHMVEVERSYFENLIAGHSKLEEAYVNYYSSNAGFFASLINYQNENYEFYFMIDREVKLIFYTDEI